MCLTSSFFTRRLLRRKPLQDQSNQVSQVETWTLKAHRKLSRGDRGWDLIAAENKDFIQCIHSVYSFSIFIQCIHSLYSFSILIQCIHSLYSFSAFIQYIHSVHSFSTSYSFLLNFQSKLKKIKKKYKDQDEEERDLRMMLLAVSVDDDADICNDDMSS